MYFFKILVIIFLFAQYSEGRPRRTYCSDYLHECCDTGRGWKYDICVRTENNNCRDRALSTVLFNEEFCREAMYACIEEEEARAKFEAVI